VVRQPVSCTCTCVALAPPSVLGVSGLWLKTTFVVFIRVCVPSRVIDFWNSGAGSTV
jgi:hypothetical protein